MTEIAIHRFHLKMVVIAHLAPRMHHPVEAFTGLPQNARPILLILVRHIDILALVAARGDVINRTGKFES